MQNTEKLLLLVACILLSACGNYIEQTDSQSQISKEAQQKLASNFVSVKQFVFSARCTSCHQQYNNYRGVIRELSAIRSAVVSNRMPKTGGPLSDEQRNVLLTWIDGGAPEHIGGPNMPNEPVQLAPNWSSLSENVFVPKCLVCHNPQGQAKFLDLSSRQIIFDNRNRIFANGKKLIDIDVPDKSYLLEIVNDNEEPMPPIESNITRLTEVEISTINDWIGLGLP
ncbi:MAG: hypothetical protein ABL927_01345 [Bdellovibrionales bacterium]